MGMCEFKMARTRCRERSFERMAWDLRSLSLREGRVADQDTSRQQIDRSTMTYLSVASGFIVNLQSARNTRNASLMNKSFVDKGCKGS